MKEIINENINTNDLIEKSNEGFEVATMQASYSQIIEWLKSGESSLLNAALLKINRVDNKEDALLFVSKLVGNETKVREKTSFKLFAFIQDEKMKEFFQSKDVLSIILKGVDDVNPTICRNVIDILTFVEDKTFIIENIIQKVNVLSQEVLGLEDVKNHQNNKILFNLYWNMQALVYLSALFKEDVKCFKEGLIEVIEQNKSQFSYQIREKSAFICFNLLNVFDDERLVELKNIFKEDENFYVRRIFTC